MMLLAREGALCNGESVQMCQLVLILILALAITSSYTVTRVTHQMRTTTFDLVQVLFFFCIVSEGDTGPSRQSQLFLHSPAGHGT